MDKMRQADIVIYLFDVTEMSAEELHEVEAAYKKEQLHYLLVGNKVDGKEAEARQKFADFAETLFISARDQVHIDELRKTLLGKVLQGSLQTEDTIVTNTRHYAALQQLDNALSDVTIGLEAQLPGDLLALDIRRCLLYLGEITGEITNEDQLDYIFSKFCIGK
jgi:tRNA modification GTPase